LPLFTPSNTAISYAQNQAKYQSQYGDLTNLEGFSDIESQANLDLDQYAIPSDIQERSERTALKLNELKKRTPPASKEERYEAIKKELPSIPPAVVESIYDLSPDAIIIFKNNLTKYAAIEDKARQNRFVAKAEESVDAQFSGKSEDEKKALVESAKKAAEQAAEDVRTGEQTEEQASNKLDGYFSKELAKAASFIHQNFLIRYVKELSKYSKDIANATVGSKTLVSEGTDTSKNPVGTILGQGDGYKILTMPTEKLSLLVPKMKLFKVTYGGNSSARVEIERTEIPFPTTSMGYSTTGKIFHQNPDSKDTRSFFKNRDGFGIKSFEWVLSGQDEAAKFVDVGAKLSLYFQDFGQLVAERRNNKGKKYRYLDLILEARDRAAQDKKDKEEAGQLNLLDENNINYIAIEVGWANPQTSEFTSEELEAIEANKQTLLLSIVEHSINFDDSGAGHFTLDIEYHSSYEKMMKSRTVNAIAPDLEACKEIQKITKEIDELKAEQDKIGGKDLSSDIETKTSELTRVKQKAGEQSRTEIFKTLVNNNKIFKIEPTLADILVFQGVNLGVTNAILKQLEVKNQATLTEDISQKVLSIQEDPSEESEQIYFTYFGSIIEAAMENALTKEKIKALGGPDFLANTQLAAFTNIELSGTEVNMYDIPVDVRLLANFLDTEVIEPKKETVPLNVFIKNLMLRIMESKIEEYARQYNSSNREYKTTFITTKDKLIGRQNKTAVKSKLSEGVNFSYLVVYSSPLNGLDRQLPDPKNYYLSKKKDQEENRIYHFSFGGADSIVKTINFEKTDIEGLRTQRIAEGSSPYAVLYNVYNADISMFGNTMFYPGSLVYVNPSNSIGDGGRPWIKGSVFNIMGLGGYHIIRNVTNTISDGVFSTQLKATYVSSGNKVTNLKKEEK
jgi:hypothetical protein